MSPKVNPAVDDYAAKVERFIELWREEMISDMELIASIKSLTSQVARSVPHVNQTSP